MAIVSHVHQMLEQATAVLPVTDEELIYKGIAAGISERILAIRNAEARLEGRCGSLEELERHIERRGISPDDHSLYTDLLEWQALKHELTELLHILEALPGDPRTCGNAL